MQAVANLKVKTKVIVMYMFSVLTLRKTTTARWGGYFGDAKPAP